MKKIRFYKYHGCGNDFIIIKEKDVKDISKVSLVKQITNRNKGVGADGVIFSDQLKMEFYNQDGTKGEMCGNGLRSLCAFLCDEGLKQQKFTVNTELVDMECELIQKNPYIFKVCFSDYSFDPKRLSLEMSKEMKNEIMYFKEKPYSVNAIFLGVPHLIVYTDESSEEMGAYFCNHPFFKNRINVDFVSVKDEKNIYLTTYERGVGFTKACGTGASASFLITYLNKKCKNEAVVHMEGGSLLLKYEDEKIYMQGEARKICDGTYFMEEI